MADKIAWYDAGVREFGLHRLKTDCETHQYIKVTVRWLWVVCHFLTNVYVITMKSQAKLRLHIPHYITKILQCFAYLEQYLITMSFSWHRFRNRTLSQPAMLKVMSNILCSTIIDFYFSDVAIGFMIPMGRPHGPGHSVRSSQMGLVSH